jgi:hypothetical protein
MALPALKVTTLPPPDAVVTEIVSVLQRKVAQDASPVSPGGVRTDRNE